MERVLIRRAIEAMTNAYAPYSKFPVGAALLTAEGEIITGCNVENASYGLTMCAERVAMYTACCKGKPEITHITVAANTDEPISPCGACCQVMVELAPNAEIILTNRDGSQTITTKIEELLPFSFQL